MTTRCELEVNELKNGLRQKYLILLSVMIIRCLAREKSAKENVTRTFQKSNLSNFWLAQYKAFN